MYSGGYMEKVLRINLTHKTFEMEKLTPETAKAHDLGYTTAYTGADHCRRYAFQEIFGIPVPEEVEGFGVEGKTKLTMLKEYYTARGWHPLPTSWRCRRGDRQTIMLQEPAP